MDALADVRCGHHRIFCRRPVPKGVAAAQPGGAVRLWGAVRHPHLRWDYEPGVGADVAPELNWKVILTYYVTGFPFDCIQAAATWLFLWFAAEPMLEKLDRIKVKYGLVE